MFQHSELLSDCAETLTPKVVPSQSTKPEYQATVSNWAGYWEKNPWDVKSAKKLKSQRIKVIKDLERKLEENITYLKESRECVKILDEKLQLQKSQLLDKDNAIKMSAHKSSSLQIGELYNYSTLRT